ncbi:Acyl-coenzyme A thioesterase PaaI, contains HGG motif [Amycolatopsis arida]|uniref:Acyl-coenzyme A thioesterase THEM4 n=1 Tax=Amycolatopsis arida TaxID=587909 RepID=A0A1I5SKZ9_9PSEU|nr:PaaI family thioesterase [Amycolatopsis arida]TDX96443.1 acyl-coenzyme A thioesterase PaaI-like protein [Amycolatopsis arida]SFP71393.1 Acyl-coenzyme A thioesterase PaaI, contains HGG motif [Amycolatopsis arida]
MTKQAQPWPPAGAEPAPAHPKAPGPGSELGVHFTECFGCGDELEGGLHLRSTVADGLTVRSRFTVTKNHQGAPGLAHGGLLACAFDEALGTTVGNLLRRPAVTGRLETDFRRPVPVGSTLHIEARVDGVGGRKIYASADGRLDAEDGPVAVRARGLFVMVGLEHFTSHGDPDAIEKFREQGRPVREDWDINP